MTPQDVSIHAPVWGATNKRGISSKKMMFQSTHPCGVRQVAWDDPNNDFVSIHAPVWGATQFRVMSITKDDVSIHAPVWGATTSGDGKSLSSGFNPRTRVGCDWQHRLAKSPRLFQSTHPCGVRHISLICSGASGCFNPRTRVGCDAISTTNLLVVGVSIHAPVWGATQLSLA